MSSPRLLLLDEPSMGLAPMIVESIFRIIGEIRDSGTTVFLVEQNAFQALRLADRGYVMENGVIAFSDDAHKLLDDERVRAVYLGESQDDPQPVSPPQDDPQLKSLTQDDPQSVPAPQDDPQPESTPPGE
jgi:ABC-type multidrug transport system ATPase subunit